MAKRPSTSQNVRSRGGCQTCKNRRKKCDETKPICIRCLKGGHECLGYEPVKPPRKPASKPTATRTVANTTTPAPPATANMNPSLLGGELLDFLDPSLLPLPGSDELLAMPPNSVQYDSTQYHFWGDPTQLPYSALDTSLGSPATQSSTSSSSPSPLIQSQDDSLAFLSALSGPSMFAPPERTNYSSPCSPVSSESWSSSTTLVGSPGSDKCSSPEAQSSQVVAVRPRSPASSSALSILRVGKLFSNELWNSLLDMYSVFYKKMAFDWGRMHIDVASMIRTKASKSPVIRNSMFAIAALHQSIHIQTDRPSDRWKWRKRAIEFNADAHALLVDELSRQDLTPKRKFAIMMELLVFELGTRTARAESTRVLLEECRELIIASLGSSHINIASFRGVDSINYALFAWIDIMNSMLLAKPTLLTYYSTEPAPECFGTGADACRIGLEAIVYCPDAITLCLFHTSALREHARADLARDGALSEMTRTSAALIEGAIRAWTLTTATSSAIPIQSQPERLTIQECWRLTALIYLYQAVYHVGPLHAVLADCVEQIMALAKTVPRTEINDMCLLTPYFFVGTAAVKKTDRAYLRARLAVYEAPGIVEYIEVLDELWARTDITGAAVSWGEIINARPLPRLTLE